MKTKDRRMTEARVAKLKKNSEAILARLNANEKEVTKTSTRLKRLQARSRKLYKELNAAAGLYVIVALRST